MDTKINLEIHIYSKAMENGSHGRDAELLIIDYEDSILGVLSILAVAVKNVIQTCYTLRTYRQELYGLNAFGERESSHDTLSELFTVLLSFECVKKGRPFLVFRHKINIAIKLGHNHFADH